MDKQKDKIVSAMRTDPERVWYAKDFQGGGVSFIGYEAWPRLCELVDDGLVERVWYNGRFMGFRLLREPREPVVRIKKRKIIEPVEPEGEWTPTEADFEQWGFYKNPQSTSGSVLYILKIRDYKGELVLQLEYLSEWLVFWYNNNARKFKPSRKDIETIIKLFPKQ